MPTRGYSLGMRQRLGVAIALLKDPELLILDEPANGLDPAGIREMRDLLRRLGDEGRTVFVSSHQLVEVQQVCDRVGIVVAGRMVATGTVAEVMAGSSSSGDPRPRREPSCRVRRAARGRVRGGGDRGLPAGHRSVPDDDPGKIAGCSASAACGRRSSDPRRSASRTSSCS